MALIAVSGQPGCRFEEVARITALRMGFDSITESRMQKLIADEFGSGTPIPERAYLLVAASIIAGLATEHHLVLSFAWAESLVRNIPGILRVHVVAPEAVRAGNLMVERRLDRPAAKELLWDLENQRSAARRKQFGKSSLAPHQFDLVLNAENFDSERMAAMIEAAMHNLGLREQGYLSAAAEAQLQFQIRLRLSKFGIAPPGDVGLTRAMFAHQSEQVFANLLDFYRIAWEYEPRSFPIRWDEQGKVLESFTPDFYLPEFDLYVELTTMKQSLVTKKNRKVRMLKELYPQLNIHVFYQKDFENLVFKYGLADRFVRA